jgi:hypothetical protein
MLVVVAEAFITYLVPLLVLAVLVAVVMVEVLEDLEALELQIWAVAVVEAHYLTLALKVVVQAVQAS